MIRGIAVAAAATLLLAAAARGEEGSAAAELAARLAAFDQLAGRFEQRVSGAAAATPPVSSGRFSLRRPDSFRWEISAPDSQLLVASDGVLWHYDRDLETVTRRALGDGASTPLLLLAADEEELAGTFAVSRRGPDGYRLQPLAPGAGFREATVRFDGDLPAAMDIVDNLEQEIAIRFFDASPDAVAAGDFSFTPPPGADVYVDGEGRP